MASVTGSRSVSVLVTLVILISAWSIAPADAQVCVNGFQCYNCTAAQVCVSGIPTSSIITCPAGFSCYNNAILACVAGACPTTTTTQAPPAFTCVNEGRFPDPLDATKYYMCVLNTDGTLAKISVACPTGSTFSTTALMCVLITTTTTTTTAATTTTTTTTAAPTYTCTAVGRFSDATNCSNYYMCQINSAGGWYTYKYTCPSTTLFSPTTKKCVLAALSGCTSG